MKSMLKIVILTFLVSEIAPKYLVMSYTRNLNKPEQ